VDVGGTTAEHETARSAQRTGEPTDAPSPGAVLFVEAHLRENGGLRVTLGHAARFQAAGVRTTLAVVQDADDAPVATPPAGVRTVMLTARGSRLRYTAPLALARLVVRARRADVVVSGSEIGPGLLLGFAAARLSRRPFAVLVQAAVDKSLEDWVSPRLRPVVRWVLGHADLGVCVGEATVPGVLATGLPADRAPVVVNGVDVAAIRARAGLPPGPEADEDQPAPRSGGRPVVVANGRLTVQKDYPALVRAHERVLRSGLDHELVIMGEGPDRAEIEAVVDELGLTGSVTLAGFVPNPYERMASADLFVLSSLSEGMPLTLLEALAVGAPVVSTRCEGGPATLLGEGRYGDLVPSGSVEALAEAMERALREPGPLRAKARRGPGRAREFDADRAARALLRLLGGLSARR
jgi:glycosyltransferase involved in cell wall biosynthesis